MHIQELLQPIVQFLHIHPHWAGFFAFCVVFCEAMAVLGVIVPGTVTMTAIGILIGSHVIPAISTFTWAICGAILGDYLSYLIGIHFQDRLHRMWPFSKYPHWLEMGEKFFHKHGGKSVIIGRFIGPMRAMTPMVAGMLKMTRGRFLLAAIPSASIWAVLYIVPGVLLGTLSLELPPKLATEFLLFFMAVVIVIWFITWLITTFLTQICRAANFIIMKIWHSLERFRISRFILRKFADPRHPDDHRQLTLLVAAAISFTLFMLFMAAAMHHGKLTLLNEPLYHLLRSFRTRTFDIIMLAFTFLGQPKSLILASLGIALFWVWKRRWQAVSYFLLTVFVAASTTEFFKYWVNSPRPTGLLNSPITPSFPSGHTVLTAVVFGFLSVIISRVLKQRKWIPYVITIAITLCVGFSRLYLGAHWLTDVVGGMLLAITIILVMTLFYRTHAQHDLDLKNSFSAIIIFILIAWISYGALHYKRDLFNYQPTWPTRSIALTAWQTQNHNASKMPLYRSNRFGHPIDVLNVEWLNNLDTIEALLTKQGWQSYSADFTIQGIVQRLSAHPTKSRLPILSQLYNNHPEALLLVLPNKDGTPYMLFRLWQSDIKVNGTKYPLWIGSINYYRAPHIIYFHQQNHAFQSAIKDFTKYLKGLRWKIINYSQDKQPEKMQNLNWDNQMLIIEGRLHKHRTLPTLSQKIHQLIPNFSHTISRVDAVFASH